MFFIWEELDKDEFRLVDLIEPETRIYSLSHINKKLTGFNFRQKTIKADYMKKWLDDRGLVPSVRPQNRKYAVITYKELLYFYHLVDDFTKKTHFNSYIKHKYKRVDEVKIMIEKAEKIMDGAYVAK